MKDLDVFVRVGTTNHPAKIDSMVRLSDELVDTKSLRVRWIVNNKKEVAGLSSVVPMYSSEGNNKKRIPTKPPKPTSIIPLKTHKSREVKLPEEVACWVILQMQTLHQLQLLTCKTKDCKNGSKKK